MNSAIDYGAFSKDSTCKLSLIIVLFGRLIWD